MNTTSNIPKESNIYAKLGAICNFLWGLLHFIVAGAMFYKMNELGGGVGVTVVVGTGVDPDTLPTSVDAVTGGLLGQHAWNVLGYGIAAMILAFYNWKNGVASVIANIALISAADIGFIIFVLAPGYISMADGIHGPILWILGSIFSILGLRRGKAA